MTATAAERADGSARSHELVRTWPVVIVTSCKNREAVAALPGERGAAVGGHRRGTVNGTVNSSPAVHESRPGQGPIIGVTLNRACSRPNWYITSATRWIRTLSMAMG